MVIGSFVILAPAVTWPRNPFDDSGLGGLTSELSRFIAKARSASRQSYLGHSSNVCRRMLLGRWLDMSSQSMKRKVVTHRSKLFLTKFLKILCCQILDEWVQWPVLLCWRMKSTRQWRCSTGSTWSIKPCALIVSSTGCKLSNAVVLVGKTSCPGALSYMNGWQASRDGRCSAQQQKGWAKGRQGQKAVRFDRVWSGHNWANQ